MEIILTILFLLLISVDILFAIVCSLSLSDRDFWLSLKFIACGVANFLGLLFIWSGHLSLSLVVLISTFIISCVLFLSSQHQGYLDEEELNVN